IGHLFAKESWSAEEMRQGHQASRFFARLFAKPELAFEATDQPSFRRGLIRLRDWFESLCRDNKSLAKMIFTLNAGPFFGGEVNANDYQKMTIVGSIPIADKRARFVLLSDGDQSDSMIIGVVNEDNSARWLKRHDDRRDKSGRLDFKERTAHPVPGYGFVV